MGNNKKTKEPPLEHWQKLVEIFFDFAEKKFSEKPTFDGSAPRDLKSIILALKKRADDSGVAWTEDVAVKRFTKFLEFVYGDPWLKENFILSTINRHKDKIFFRIKQNSNAANIGSSKTKPVATINPQGSFGNL